VCGIVSQLFSLFYLALEQVSFLIMLCIFFASPERTVFEENIAMRNASITTGNPQGLSLVIKA
jgi:hypothetical protein